MVLSLFANCRVAPYARDPELAEQVILGPFVEMVLDRLELYEDERTVTVWASDERCTMTGDWKEPDPDVRWFPTPTVAATGSGAEQIFEFDLPSPGFYEVTYSHATLENGSRAGRISLEEWDAEEERWNRLTFKSHNFEDYAGERWFKLTERELSAPKVRVVLHDDRDWDADVVIGLAGVRLKGYPAAGADEAPLLLARGE